MAMRFRAAKLGWLVLALSVVGLGVVCERSPPRPVGPVIGAGKSGPPTVATQPRAWFQDQSVSSGVDFKHVSGNSKEKPFPAANGSGVGLVDFDRDGLLDLYFATGTPFPLDAQVERPTNRFYRNLGGWRFEEVTAAAGLGHDGYSAGIAAADYNNDGFTDLYVTCYGANVLYRNQGDGTFQEVSREANADDNRWATSGAFLDVDADGALELYVCNYGTWDFESRIFCGDRAKNVRIFCSPTSVKAVGDLLLNNLGDGTFADGTAAVAPDGTAGRGQGVIAADLNGDGWIDIYVGNDLHANFLFVNQGDGTYRDMTELSGAGYDDVGSMQAGMGVDVEDIDGDHRPELFVTNFKEEQNTLYRNNGDAMFADSSSRYGLSAPSWPYVGWGTAFADFDLDGKSDLVVTNGHVDDNRHLLGQEVPYAVPPLLWRHRGTRFELIKHPADNYFSGAHVGRGLACGDLDNDNDEDVVVAHQDARPAILSNEAPTAAMNQSAISIQLVGVRSNRDAIGSAVSLRAADRSKSQQIKGGGSYLSTRDPRQLFAILPGETEIELAIRWPNRDESTIHGLAPGGRYIIVEAAESEAQPLVYEVGAQNE